MRVLAVLPLLVAGRVLVLAPKELKQQLAAEIRASLGNFGTPPYGSSIIGRAFFPETGYESACGNVEVPAPDSAFILIVNRGGCSFGDKVWSAQAAGAKAVLVVDDREELVEAVIMSDSEQFRSIEIPAFLVSMQDGAVLRKFIVEMQAEVVLKLHFEMRRSEKVEMALWYSANEARANSFFQQFSKYGSVFPKSLLLVKPHFAVWTCSECRETGFQSDHPDCISGGRYCAPDPDGWGPRTGRDVMLEDLRQNCVFSQTAHSDSYAVWFSYLSAFSESCASDLTANCSNSALKRVGLSPDAVDQCVRSSFHSESVALADNFVMSKEAMLWQTASPGYFPALLLNGVSYMGTWDGQQVASAMCASLTDMPEACEHLESPTSPSSDSSSAALAVVLAVVCALLVVAAGAALRWGVKRHIRREVDKEVRARLVGSSEAELAARSSG